MLWVLICTVHLTVLNGRVFVYELIGCGFESSCSHLNFMQKPATESNFAKLLSIDDLLNVGKIMKIKQPIFKFWADFFKKLTLL